MRERDEIDIDIEESANKGTSTTEMIGYVAEALFDIRDLLKEKSNNS